MYLEADATMKPLDFQQDFFSLFNLPVQFEIDANVLDQNFRALQAQVHPDKFSHLSESEQRVSMQWSTQVNEAYQTLRKPIDRARYVLKLRGVDTQEETNTAMPVDFLIQQMAAREALEAALSAQDTAAITALEDQLQLDMRALQQQLTFALDVQQADQVAAELVRKLRFLEKMTEEISSAFDELDY